MIPPKKHLLKHQPVVTQIALMVRGLHIQCVSVPVQCVSVPVQCVYVPIQCVSVPVQCVCVPVQCVCVPVQCVYIPVKCLYIPVQRVSVPVQCVSVPVQCVYVPVQCMSVLIQCVSVLAQYMLIRMNLHSVILSRTVCVSTYIRMFVHAIPRVSQYMHTYAHTYVCMSTTQDGNTFCTSLTPRLFTIDLSIHEHKVFFNEVSNMSCTYVFSVL